MSTTEQTPEPTQAETPERVIGHYHRGKLERLDWTESRNAGHSVWLHSVRCPNVCVRVGFDGLVTFPNDVDLTSAELRAFAGVADSERRDEAGQPLPEQPLLNLSDEQRALAEDLARRFAAAGINLSPDEAQLVVTLADLGRQTIDKSETDGDAPVKLRAKSTTELCSGDTRRSQICLAILAKLTVRQHVSGYANDPNLRALDLIDSVLHVLAVLAPDKRKVKHIHG
jgi:hypothetical protein